MTSFAIHIIYLYLITFMDYLLFYLKTSIPYQYFLYYSKKLQEQIIPNSVSN